MNWRQSVLVTGETLQISDIFEGKSLVQSLFQVESGGILLHERAVVCRVAVRKLALGGGDLRRACVVIGQFGNEILQLVVLKLLNGGGIHIFLEGRGDLLVL